MAPRTLRSPWAVVFGLALAGSLGASCTSATSSAGPPPPQTITYSHLEGTRFCEVVIVNQFSSGLEANVFSSFPINTCPEAEWKTLTPPLISSVDGGLAVNLEGPRFWLMDSMSRYLVGEQAVTTTKMGKITMHQTATAHTGSLRPLPYSPAAVDREATFTYVPGQQIYELTDPFHRQWVMDSWSQGADPTLQESELSRLGGRLHLPSGWSFSTRHLGAALVVSSMHSSAESLQDTFGDSYTLEGSASG